MNNTNIHALRRRGQAGFGIGYLLVIVAILGALGAYFAQSNRGSTPSADPEKAKTSAIAVVEQGNSLRNAIIRYAQDRDITAMTLATTASVGLYDPNLGLATQVPVARTATAAGTADVDFELDTSTFVVTGLGSAAAERAVYVDGLSEPVCKQINRVLYNVSVDAAVPTSVGSREEGCANMTVGGTASNVYYRVVQAL